MFGSRSQNRHKHWYHKLIVGHRKLWLIGIALALILVSVVTVLIVYSVRATGYDINLVCTAPYGNVLYDRDNQMVAVLSERDNTPVEWNDLPPHLIQAFVAREDAHFFDHGGVVYSAVLRSLLRNITSFRYKEGASTITMQLTRNVYELQGKTLDRKLLEIMLAQRIEQNYDKRTILCQYLSRIFFGQGCYGLREAARYYFGKAVRDLTLAESAMLAGIVRAPSLYNPKRSAASARNVRRETLQRMLELEMITQAQYDEAMDAPIPGEPFFNTESAKRASYPAEWANDELNKLPDMQEELGKGVAVSCYLLPTLQEYAEAAVAHTLAAVESATAPTPDEWSELPNAAALADVFAKTQRPARLRPWGSRLKAGETVLQCCVLVLDARTNTCGCILAVTGGRDATDGVNRWQGEIEPGRAIAPLVFCSACLPGGDVQPIVAQSPSITGSSLGYDVVRAFFDTLQLGVELPERSNEAALYDGLFRLPRLKLAHVLFSIQHMGRGHRPRLISAVWSHARHLLYSDHDDARATEYIRRESALAVAHIPPFQYHEGEPVVLHTELPNNGGYWTMVSNDRGAAVFVWMGEESPAGEQPAADRKLNMLISRASLTLAKTLHSAARRELRNLNRKPASSK